MVAGAYAARIISMVMRQAMAAIAKRHVDLMRSWTPACTSECTSQHSGGGTPGSQHAARRAAPLLLPDRCCMLTLSFPSGRLICASDAPGGLPARGEKR